MKPGYSLAQIGLHWLVALLVPVQSRAFFDSRGALKKFERRASNLLNAVFVETISFLPGDFRSVSWKFLGDAR
ncbi:hypothetical protein ACCT03_07965 [Rhizobium johnstonii]|uniref:Uncharacterized protein n=1 Tax=Rhizobium leguminosarum bv. viciae TaxID=387 RepID=A0A8G2IZ15_RHILV|nr:hypothetical protein [Rhizobium leguminosarum]MBY5324022.1 hypothetical protein [Rhizobium leguminosarum]MBY5381839.1 hypothetical protein [Rhizobium leguminosarum]MCA2433192.1 hypothetical protein [Rhizobium leguminosarum]NEH45124.1 hypothetical protein [Rhizobium leguminosarum]NEH69016.1 hypothetical protein [Rhizobium leguminosarum]